MMYLRAIQDRDVLDKVYVSAALVTFSLATGYFIGRWHNSWRPTSTTGTAELLHPEPELLLPATRSSFLSKYFGFRKRPRMEGAETVKMVIVVHRHGARLPNKCVTRDLSWPKNKKFYDQYSGHLSPVGCQMLVDMGVSFRKRYLEGSDLFLGVAPSALHKYVVVYTSNMQRTLFSAWSFLHGMFPGVPKHFSYASDRLKVNLKEVKKLLAKRKESLGIPIYIEEVARNDRLFHQYKMERHLSEWQRKNIALSPTLQKISRSPEFMALVEKLYVMTALPQLGSETTIVEKLFVMKRVQTQINIANSHGLPLLPNKEGHRLEADELILIKTIATEIWKLLYQPACGKELSDGMGNNAASHLAHYITQLMYDRAEKKNKLRVVEYSAHDTTLLALAARLGIDITPPEFAGYFLFELHFTQDSQGRVVDEPMVKFFYNRAPQFIPIDSLPPLRLEFNQKISKLPELLQKPFALHRMVADCQTNGMRQSTRILRKLCKVRRPQKKTSTLSEYALKMMTAQQHADFFTVFQMWDREGKGYITLSDLGTAMRLMGKHPSKEHLRQIIELFHDTVSEEGEKGLVFDAFLEMMVMCNLDRDEEDSLEDALAKDTPLRTRKKTFREADEEDEGSSAGMSCGGGTSQQNNGRTTPDEEDEAESEDINTTTNYNNDIYYNNANLKRRLKYRHPYLTRVSEERPNPTSCQEVETSYCDTKHREFRSSTENSPGRTSQSVESSVSPKQSTGLGDSNDILAGSNPLNHPDRHSQPSQLFEPSRHSSSSALEPELKEAQGSLTGFKSRGVDIPTRKAKSVTPCGTESSWENEEKKRYHFRRHSSAPLPEMSDCNSDSSGSYLRSGSEVLLKTEDVKETGEGSAREGRTVLSLNVAGDTTDGNDESESGSPGTVRTMRYRRSSKAYQLVESAVKTAASLLHVEVSPTLSTTTPLSSRSGLSTLRHSASNVEEIADRYLFIDPEDEEDEEEEEEERGLLRKESEEC